MPTKSVKPYGSWPSPIEASLLTAAGVKLSQPKLNHGYTCWLESRPSEQGRSVLVRQKAGDLAQDITPSAYSVRSSVNEYGGGDYCLGGDYVYFVNAVDQQIYAQNWTQIEAIQQLTHVPLTRYADLTYDINNHRLIAIQEDLSNVDAESVHRIVSLDLQSNHLTTLREGADFYASPSISPCGHYLAWLSWNHPNMPWDENQCWLAAFDALGRLQHLQHITPVTSSSFQPQWSPAGELFVVNDQSGWWNVYRWCNGKLLAVAPMEAEFATPQWVFGMSCYGFQGHQLLVTYTQSGTWHLATIDTNNAPCILQPVENSFCDISAIFCAQNGAVMLAANHQQATAVWTWQKQQWCCVKQSVPNTLPDNTWSSPQAITFDTTDNSVAHGFYYPPHNECFKSVPNEKPPLIVLSHGGPTAATESALNLKIQYWTHRGFAVLDVNYRGSTGYGRDYRNSLRGLWGVADVDDVCAGAHFLVAQGRADPNRLIIKGSSAGGYTVLAALTFRDTFNAGTSLYGIGDLSALATDTHKFESRYLDGLVAPWPAGKDIYQRRSPLRHCQQLHSPVLFFQGLKDKVVPPNQAEAMVNALKQQGIQTAFVTFPDEGHGFRQAQSIVDQLELELNFYGHIFNIEVHPRRDDFTFA